MLSAARPRGLTAGFRPACRERGPLLSGLPSRSSTRKEASRSGAKAGVPDGIGYAGPGGRTAATSCLNNAGTGLAFGPLGLLTGG